VKTVVVREQLLGTLQACEAGLSGNEKIEQSTCFVFRNGRVHTFNEEVAVVAASGLPKEFTGAVQAGLLLSFLKKIPDPKLRSDVKGGHWILQGSGGSDGAKFRYAEKIQLPVDAVETPDKADWRRLPAGFAEAVSIVQECTGSDESQTAMSCVHLTPDHVESFEKFQATRYTLKLPIDGDFLVKPKGLKHVVALDCTRVAVGKEWVHFRNDGGIRISCRRYDEPFPDLDPALDMPDGRKVELPDGMDAAISRAEDFSKENTDANHLLVVLEDGLLKIEAIGITAEYWKDMTVRYDGKPLAFLIAPKMLAEVVRRSSRVRVNQEKLKVKGPGWAYVTSLTDPEQARQAAKEEAGAPQDEEDD
jgi:hypothetical protein